MSAIYDNAPLVSEDPSVRYPAIQSFWRDIHVLLNQTKDPSAIIGEALQLIGAALGADRAYTFSVTTDGRHSSCTHEWTSRPEYVLQPYLQNLEQSVLGGWLGRFRQSNIIALEDTANPPADLEVIAAKLRNDLIKSIYLVGFYDEGHLVGYLGIDYVVSPSVLDELAFDVLYQLGSTLNLFILRHDSLELWHRLAEAMPSALFIKDVDDNLSYCFANPLYLQIYGADAVGKNDLEIFGAETGELFRRQDCECLETNNPFRYDGPQLNYSSKAPNYYSTVKFPVYTRMGRRFIAGFITDITTEHRMHLEALKLLEDAKAAEKAKSLFLASMSHEIRTPLNAIIGLVDELRHKDIPEETHDEYIRSVASASRALLALINDVLDVSKLEAGQMHMTPVETDLVVLLAECESIFAESCRGKGLEYKCIVSPDLPVLLVDQTRVRQILFNLIGNAVKFTPRGSIEVCGLFERQTHETGTLQLEITDTGVGISPEDQKHVFGMFEQASRMRGTAVQNKGTGLGLCLCKRLAECMNGEIELESELGKGSTFRVILNDVRYVEHDKASDVVKHRKDQTIRINIVSLNTKVLIVDDVPMNLKVLGIILKRMNVPFVAAGSAKEALEVLERETGVITHVLTDIWMPETNGEGLARAIRANPAWKDIRIAAQTADVEAQDNFDASVFDRILSKPLTPEKVQAFLR